MVTAVNTAYADKILQVDPNTLSQILKNFNSTDE